MRTAQQHAAARNNPARVPLASAAGFVLSISQSNHQYHSVKRFMMASMLRRLVSAGRLAFLFQGRSSQADFRL
jgi:hypothetical protein